MDDQRYATMQKAVCLALSGQCSNWWTVQARMRISGCEAANLEWTDTQRAWLDRLCAQARPSVWAVRRTRSTADSWRAAPGDDGSA